MTNCGVACLKATFRFFTTFLWASAVFSATFFSSFLLNGFVWAQSAASESFPKDFKYQNKPIDPLCIQKLSSNDMARAASVNIDDCSKHPDYQIVKVNEDLTRKGFVGYDYTFKVPNNAVLQGTSYYKYLGQIHDGVNDGHVIYSMQNMGGNGLSTSILLLKRMGNNLHLLKELAGGERCNGGIDPSVQLKDKKTITYKASVTPFDVISFSGVRMQNLQAYNDLAACAACCIGEAVFEFDLLKDTKPRLISLTLGKDAGKDEVYTQGKLQSCFNGVVRDYANKNKGGLKFSAEQLKDFAEQFNATCMK